MSVYDEIHVVRLAAQQKHLAHDIEQESFWHPGWLPILVEEIGEVATARLNANPTELRAELLQAAAVAAAWVDRIDKDLNV